MVTLAARGCLSGREQREFNGEWRKVPSSDGCSSSLQYGRDEACREMVFYAGEA